MTVLSQFSHWLFREKAPRLISRSPAKFSIWHDKTMNKKQFLNTYRKISGYSAPTQAEPAAETSKPLYRSAQDEKLIKDLHYAKFQKNQKNLHENEELRLLIEKQEWDENDVKALLRSLK